MAREAVHQLGFDSGDGQAPCRWVAVRHGRSEAGNDHVHLVVNLVHEDGKVASTRNDFKRLSALCADMECRYGLSAVEGRAKKRPCPGSPGPRRKRHAAPDGTKPNGPSWPGWCAPAPTVGDGRTRRLRS